MSSLISRLHAYAVSSSRFYSSISDSQQAAEVVSYLFHPILLPLFSYLWLGNLIGLSTDAAVSFTELIQMVLFSLFIPMLILYVLKRRGIISSYRIDRREERVIPLFFSSIVLVLGAVIGSGMVESVLAFTSALMLVFLAITLFWKISLHGGGIGVLGGLFLAVDRIDRWIALVLVVGLTFLVFWARHKLGAHNRWQLIIGWLVGFTGSILYYAWLS